MKDIFLKVVYIFFICFFVKSFADGYENQDSIKYALQDLNKIKYESEFLKLNNSVQSVDTENKVLSKELNLLKDFLQNTLDNQEKIYNITIKNLVNQHEIELKQQEKRYEALLMQQVYIFGISGTIFTVIMLIIGFIGYNRMKSMVTDIIKRDHEAKTQKMIKIYLSNLDNVKEIKASFDTLEMEDSDNNEIQQLS